MSDFPPLETQRMIIGLLEPSDAAAMYCYRTMPEIFRYQAWVPESLESLRAFAVTNTTLEPFRPGEYSQFALKLKSGNQLAGDMAVRMDADRKQAEIGFTLAPFFQGTGLAFEALSALLNHLFAVRDLHRAYASVDPDNMRSIKLLERLGFRREGHFRKSYWMRGSWYDDVIFGLLDEEWERMPWMVR